MICATIYRMGHSNLPSFTIQYTRIKGFLWFPSKRRRVRVSFRSRQIRWGCSFARAFVTALSLLTLLKHTHTHVQTRSHSQPNKYIYICIFMRVDSSLLDADLLRPKVDYTTADHIVDFWQTSLLPLYLLAQRIYCVVGRD